MTSCTAISEQNKYCQYYVDPCLKEIDFPNIIKRSVTIVVNHPKTAMMVNCAILTTVIMDGVKVVQAIRAKIALIRTTKMIGESENAGLFVSATIIVKVF